MSVIAAVMRAPREVDHFVRALRVLERHETIPLRDHPRLELNQALADADAMRPNALVQPN